MIIKKIKNKFISYSDISKNELILVNKNNKLRKSYKPNLVLMDSNYSKEGFKMDIRAYKYFKKMVNVALKDGYKIYNVSSYRSYERQKEIYKNYKRNDKLANLYSAKQGYSEHQTGLASDIICSSFKDNFHLTKEYNWLINNSYKYGFILRYPKGMEHITGYMFEPWHFRFVGLKAAYYIYKNNITFEEYYELFVK